MNLQELIAEIEGHAETIKVVQTEDYESAVILLVTYMMDSENNIVQQNSFAILIEDRGLGTETVYFKGETPPYMRTQSFQEEVVTKILAYQATHPEFEHYELGVVNPKTETAVIRAYIYDSGADTSKMTSYLIIKDTPWKFREIIE